MYTTTKKNKVKYKIKIVEEFLGKIKMNFKVKLLKTSAIHHNLALHNHLYQWHISLSMKSKPTFLFEIMKRQKQTPPLR